MTMILQILKAGFAISPRYYMFEAMEKSNHHAHKDFQPKTMRGGGKIHNPDPLCYQGFFSYCRNLKVVEKTRNKAMNLLIDEMTTTFATEKNETCTEFCHYIVPLPVIDLGAQRKKQELLFGFRLHVVGFFSGVKDNQNGVENMIIVLGGDVLTRERVLDMTNVILKLRTVSLCSITMWN